MMRKFIFVAMMLFSYISANSAGRDQVDLSVVFSGHVLVGTGYTRFFDERNALHATAYLIPANGMPMAFDVGYLRFTVGVVISKQIEPVDNSDRN
ncbi:hypothetical protein JXL83_05575 [candidate division WOR-3 bacterium]|nr:hypothetical protein [candidate division WOR-3 bacterium]